MTTLTPLYDGLLAEAFGRARSSEAAATRATAVALLHTGGAGGLCPGCGLPAPCPTASLIGGSLTVEAALSATQEALVAVATRQRLELEQAVRTAVAATGAAHGESDGETQAGEPVVDRELPAMPSAADIFAPNPAFDRALSVLLGGS